MKQVPRSPNPAVDGGDARALDARMVERSGRQFITALARGLEVLEAFGKDDPPLRNQELASRTGLPRPTISRITHTLTELGFLNYREQMGCYELGGSAVALGNVARSNIAVVAAARPFMEAMAETSGANIGLGMRERAGMVYLEVARGGSRIALNFDVGARVPMFETAMGRAYLAGAADDEATELLELLHFQCELGRREAIGTIERAREELRGRGFCTSLGEWNEAIHGAAVPIPSRNLSATVVLNCGAPAFLLSEARLMDEIGPALAHVAAEIAHLIDDRAASVADERPAPRGAASRRTGDQPETKAAWSATATPNASGPR